MTSLTSLIERIEAATEGRRELDGDIALAMNLPREAFGPVYDQRGMIDGPEYHTEKGTWSGHGMTWRAPDFTTSIDAARSIDPNALCVFASDIGADGMSMVKVVTDTSTNPIVEYTGIAATLELAWCAAILRARQTEVRHDES